jgi:hypothetical protein
VQLDVQTSLPHQMNQATTATTNHGSQTKRESQSQGSQMITENREKQHTFSPSSPSSSPSSPSSPSSSPSSSPCGVKGQRSDGSEVRGQRSDGSEVRGQRAAWNDAAFASSVVPMGHSHRRQQKEKSREQHTSTF